MRTKSKLLLFTTLAIVCSFVFNHAHADDTDMFAGAYKPNILIILDNSNSMDEDFYGNAVGSYSSSSKSVVGRNALINLVSTYVNSTRIGLMAYRLPAARKYYLHNSAYFASYEPKSYCPNPPSECVDYCKTGDAAKQTTCQSTCASQNSSFDATYMDEIITGSAIGSEKRNSYCSLVYPKTQRITNPTDTSRYIYYKQALPYYAGSDQGTEFDYSPAYNSGVYPAQTDQYNRYRSKTGTADDATGYSSSAGTASFVPTDSDFALGYYDFGRRMFSYYVGRTWFAETSPGNGYLHVAVNNNDPGNNDHLNSLLAKLEPKENDETGYMSCTSTSDPNTCEYIVNAGLTPTKGTFQSAIDYFKGINGYTTPIEDWCQKNYIIYVTDGLPSVDASGHTGTADALMPDVKTKISELRALQVALGQSSYDFDIKTFVLGMGLTPEAKAKVDEMAVAGGTSVDNHAYYADNSQQFIDSLTLIISSIIEKSYSFSKTTVASSRTQDENYLYEASFEPVEDDPFWRGHLKKYKIETDNSLILSGDAGLVLASTSASSRNIKTLISGSLTSFNTTIDKQYFAVDTDTKRNKIVGYLRGESADNKDDWKLGDIFHSNPITIGTPSVFITDTRDANNAFSQYRDDNKRTTSNQKRVIIAGANDGQFHVFRTYDMAEVFSFVPPNLLPRLQNLAHDSHPVGLPHQFFVDGPLSASDAWLGPDEQDGTAKSTSDWKTVVVLGEGRGAGSNLWSSSSSCDLGFSAIYSATYQYYCGYYAFNFTSTLSPSSMWHINFTSASTQAPYLGDPWSKMSIGRVKIEGKEKWVGFIGGGYNSVSCSGGGKCTDTRGKGFYIIDLKNGDVMWSYTCSKSGNSCSTSMAYALPATPSTVDTDLDGFIDTVYIGDLGGNMWRFKLCSAASDNTCNTSNWAASRLFEASSGVIRPIYTRATVAKDPLGQVWVYWGTGDKTDPTASNAQERLFAVKDRGGSYDINDLEEININSTTSSYTDSDGKDGWRMGFSGQGEKFLSDPVVFDGIIYFTTYTPPTGQQACTQSGTSKLYALNYITAVGQFPDHERSVDAGPGYATGPSISAGPGTSGFNIFLGGGSGTPQVFNMPKRTTKKSDLFYWKDLRLR